MNEKEALVVFQGNNIRRKWLNDEWWFVIKDIILVLTDSSNPSDYLKKLRRRDEDLNNFFKGGDNLSLPSVWNLKQKEEFKYCNVGIQKVYLD